uniref:Uncharacterized protein n=1 Tax=viral metagenome TaxID=1070528 RepID=A0A6C0F4Z0_9ZZZZ
MDHRLNNLKDEFNNITDMRDGITKIFETLKIKTEKLKETYAEFIKNNKDNLFVFGLDSFHFQSKLIDIEFDDMKRLNAGIMNRIYCEYFKLYKIVQKYIQNNITDRKILELVQIENHYPIYKDLEPYKEYDYSVTQDIHENILILLGSINSVLINKEHDLRVLQQKNSTGLNIDNYVHTFSYHTTILKENLTLFITYIEFFHKLHTKYLKRFSTKIQLMFSQITHDIQFEDNAHASRERRKSMMQDFANEDIDRTLLAELKNSINDNTVAPSPTNSNSIRTDSFDDNSLHSVKYETYSELSNDQDEEIVIKNEVVNIKMHTSYVESLFNSQDNFQDNNFKEEKHVSIVEPSLKDVENRETMQKELENVLELRITETIDTKVVENVENQVVEEQTKEETIIAEDKKEEDDSSIITSATASSQSVANTDEPPKKKRTYKPRKKKGDPGL